MKPEQTPRTFDSLKSAAAGLKLPLRVLKTAKQAGCSAFRSNRVYEAELLQWLEANPAAVEAASDDPRDEKLREEIRKLRIANDAKEGRLVERAWVAERVQRAAGEWNTHRTKCEAEMPLKHAAAGEDVVQQRMVLRENFDVVGAILQSLAKHFEEEAK